jgi:arylsulfatase A
MKTVARLLFLLLFPASAFSASLPNIVFILVDDLGYGDLSSYGARDIATPNIDRLATEGMRFTNFYTPANTCSPSRASLLTGRYPPRTGVNAVIFYDSVEGLPLSEITLAEMLGDAGYDTGMVGKWHLGQVEEFMPWHQGFQTFFGVATSNDDKNFYFYESSGTDYRRLPDTVDQTQLTQEYNKHALLFIEQHANKTKPFFLYFSHNQPHIPLHPNAKFVGGSQRGIYGDAVQEVDDSVGQVLSKLKELNIDEKTIVVFSSDNGAWRTMRDWGGDNGILREGKLTAFEGGHRVPALVRWPAHVAGGSESHDMVTMMDWFPTFAHLTKANLPVDRVIDGKDLTAVLDGSGKREASPFYYFALRPPHEQQTHLLAAVRDGKWKLKLAQSGYYPKVLEPLMKVGLYWHGDMLFDLEADPSETNNVIKHHPDVAQRLRKQIDEFNSSNKMPVPVMIEASPADQAGWENLWIGVTETVILVLVALIVVMVMIVHLFRRLVLRSKHL